MKDWQFEDYVQYINDPKVFVNPVKDIIMFDNPVIEVLSKTPWWVIPIAYTPLEMLFSYNMYKGIQEGEISVYSSFLYVIAGLIVWSLGEYLLHRFFFHGEDTWMKYVPFNRFLWTFHFTIHGIHHAFPSDRYRLVMPPVVGHIIFYIVFYLPITTIFKPAIAHSIFMGMAIMYQVYDLGHYYVHHNNPSEGSYFKMMKTYHMQHHYKFGTIGFGVSSKFWDVVFNTEILSEKKEN